MGDLIKLIATFTISDKNTKNEFLLLKYCSKVDCLGYIFILTEVNYSIYFFPIIDQFIFIYKLSSVLYTFPFLVNYFNKIIFYLNILDYLPGCIFQHKFFMLYILYILLRYNYWHTKIHEFK